MSPTQRILAYFKHDHLPVDLQNVAMYFWDLAHRMERDLPDGPEKTVMMRKLLEAKDCAVRAKLPEPEAPIKSGW